MLRNSKVKTSRQSVVTLIRNETWNDFYSLDDALLTSSPKTRWLIVLRYFPDELFRAPKRRLYVIKRKLEFPFCLFWQ